MFDVDLIRIIPEYLSEKTANFKVHTLSGNVFIFILNQIIIQHYIKQLK